MDPLVRQASERREPGPDVAPVRVIAAGLALEVEEVSKREAVGEAPGDVLEKELDFIYLFFRWG